MSKIDFDKLIPCIYVIEDPNMGWTWAHVTEKGHLKVLKDLMSRNRIQFRTYAYKPVDTTDEMMKKVKDLK